MSTIRATLPLVLDRPLTQRRREAGRAEQTAGRPRWRRADACAAAAFASIGVAVSADAWEDLARTAWGSEELGYILLVPVLAVWLAWVRRGRLPLCRSEGQWLGPVLAGIAVASYVLGDAWMIDTLWYAGAITLPLAGLITIFGRDALFAFAPALVTMLFCIPMPGSVRNALGMPLQEITATTTEAALVLLGMPIARSGNLLTINGHGIAVAEACNGLRMAIPLMLVCFAYAFALPLRNWVRAMLLILAPLFAVGCNMIRMMPTAWAYGYASPEFASQFHDLAGWGMLLVSAALVMASIQALQWIGLPVLRYRIGEAVH